MEFLLPKDLPIYYKGWIMRLTCLLVALGCTGLQLLMAHPGHGQALNDVSVSLELKNESLRTAFTRIEKQTDFRFAYNRQSVDEYKNITVPKGAYTLEKALTLLLSGTRLSFKQIGNKIIIFRQEEPVAASPDPPTEAAPEAQQGGTIRGKVTTDKDDPLSGASIVVVGSDKGISADAGGLYTISGLKPGRYTLQVSAVGFQTTQRVVSVTATGVTEINIQLKPGGNSLNEIVVTGYSKQNKRDVTGAASTVSADVIAQTPVSSVESILQGRVAGVNVDGQGGPGAAQTIRIRGVGTLGNNDPLYVIDGVQIRMGTSNGSQNISNLLDPGDIESITILKDPSLIALYGADGSNGVIVITTKTGKQGAPRLDYNSYVGFQVPKSLPSTITPQQQANALYASYRNANMPFAYESMYDTSSGSPVLPDFIIEGTNTNNLGVKSGDPAADATLYNYQNYRIIKANQAGTNWWKAIFNPSMTQNHQLTLSGANDKSNYAISLGYMDDQGTLLNSYFKRLSLRINTQFKIKPWLRLGENVEMSYTSGNSVSRNPTGDIAALYILSPLLPKYDIVGNFAGTNKALVLGNTGNPYTDRKNQTSDKSYTESIIGAAYAEVEPIRGLTYTNQIGFQFVPNEGRSYTPVEYQEPIPGTTNLFSEGGSYYTDWRWLNKVSYTATIDRIHKVSAFAGYEADEYASRSYGGTTGNIGYPSSNTEYLGNGNTGSGSAYVPTVNGGGSVNTKVSVVGNATYSLMDKYLLTGTFRRDGSSNFGPSDRYGNFGAVSAGWRLSGEKFMQNVHWINDLKIRGSYGTAGNDAWNGSVSYLGYLASGAFGAYDLAGTNTSSMSGYYPYQLGNAKLHWEENKTTNLGFDAALFNNSLTGSFNWFNRATDGLIYAPPSSGTAGSALSPYENVLNFSNKGVELELGYNGHVGREFKFDMSFNISSYHNRVNYIDGIDSTYIEGGVFGSNGAIYLSRSTVGRPVSSFFGYVYQGLYQNAQDVASHASEANFGITSANALGHVMYKDMNGDGVIDAHDETYLGNPNPKFSYGYNLNLYYKNFDFGILLQGVYGNKIFNYARTLSEYPNGAAAGQGGLSPAGLDTWSPTNPNAKLPIFSQDLTAYDLSPASNFIESGSYMRIKQIQLGYTIPHLKGVRKLRIYVQAYNLLTLTHYSGMDPEVSDGDPHNLGIDYGTSYPMSKKYLLGVNLGL